MRYLHRLKRVFFFFNQLHSLGIVVNHKRVFRFTASLVIVDVLLAIGLLAYFVLYLDQGQELTAEMLTQRVLIIIYGFMINASFIWYNCQCQTLLFAVFMRFYGLNDRFGLVHRSISSAQIFH